MNKKYISPGSWFAFEYPETWHEFEDEAGSFLFYNPNAWSGNFRISASLDASENYASEVMHDELQLYADASLVEFEGTAFVYSQETFREGESDYTSHFWVTGVGRMAVYCTFTLPVGQSPEEVELVLKSLEIANPMKPAFHEVVGIRLMEIVAIDEAFDWASKAVTKRLKRDFSSSNVTDSLNYLEKLIREDGKGTSREMVRQVGLVLGAFLVDTVDGVEWVTKIDGKIEEPVLYFCHEGECFSPVSIKQAGNRLIEPVAFVVKQWNLDNSLSLIHLYERLLDCLI